MTRAILGMSSPRPSASMSEAMIISSPGVLPSSAAFSSRPAWSAASRQRSTIILRIRTGRCPGLISYVAGKR